MHLFAFENHLFTEVTKKKKKKSKSKWGPYSSFDCFLSGWIFSWKWIIFLFVHRKKKEVPEQTDPPSIPVIDLFPSGEFPEGEIQQYKDEWVYVISTKSTQCNLFVIPIKLGFVYFYSTKYITFLQFKESVD
jgi:hypothetical protein